MLEDNLLIWRLRGGDKEAFRRIYQKYKDELLTMATSLLNEEEAEDVLYGVFISFANTAKKYRFYGSLRNYLISCVVDNIRERHREKMYQVLEVDRSGQAEPGLEKTQESALENEGVQSMVEALARIPLQQREVIILHLQAGLKFREIAEMQDIPVNTVRARYNYGLDKLRTISDGRII
jgi:RNA polymerase sigma-70 factor (ECF subfamily)